MVFEVHMPTLPALRKYAIMFTSLPFLLFGNSNVTCFASYEHREYDELLISCGIVGEALDIFKDLELWDNLIYCYRYTFHLEIPLSCHLGESLTLKSYFCYLVGYLVKCPMQLL
jgi:hypothetical protein